VVNIAALILSVYTTFTIHFLSRYQRVIVNQCESEFIQIFTALRDELSGLELKGLDEKVTVLKEQCNTINTVLSLVSALSFTNLTLNVVLYFETFIK
ncbi:hypothetical protein, partial [Rahnella aceris]|uniref:hypothetical protein n=1 Tax=Rahnella sp. (strain Y9602) TaxID=2703885 RepID=UPI001C27BA2F